MPGIVGLITMLPRQQAWAKLQQMLAVLQHEDFYVSGSWDDESLGIYVGWVAKKHSFAERMGRLVQRRTVCLFRAARKRTRHYAGADTGPLSGAGGQPYQYEAHRHYRRFLVRLEPGRFSSRAARHRHARDLRA